MSRHSASRQKQRFDHGSTSASIHEIIETMEELPTTKSITPIGGLRLPATVMYSFGVVMLLSSCVILISLFYIMSSTGTNRIQARGSPKPEPTIAIRLRVADLPPALIGAIVNDRKYKVNGNNITFVDQIERGAKNRAIHDLGDNSHMEHIAVNPNSGSNLELRGRFPIEALQQMMIAPTKTVRREIVVIPPPECSSVWQSKRIDCALDQPVATFDICSSRGCCYSPVNVTLESLEPGYVLPPACFYPSNYIGYKIEKISTTDNAKLLSLKRVTPSGISPEIEVLKVEIIKFSDTTVRIKITDPHQERYQVPMPAVSNHRFMFPSLYETSAVMSGDVEIYRPLTKKIVFHTNISTLLYTDQLLQFSTYLPSRYVYGIGEVKGSLLRSIDWFKFTLFNKGRSPVEGRNLYGSHPFFLTLDETGESTGYYLHNSNAMDILLQPNPAATFRTTGGIIDLFIFLGPSPADVIRQYQEIVGRPAMPPYWSLGYHLSRWGYKNIDEVEQTWLKNVRAGISIDGIWLDAEYTDNGKPFSYDRTGFAMLPDFAQALHKRDVRLILALHPGIDTNYRRGSYLPFDEGHRRRLFIGSATGEYAYGMVGNRTHLVYPDFTHPDSTEYWLKMLAYFHEVVEYDGLWLDLNEPSSLYNGSSHGCPLDPRENPVYIPGEEKLKTNTLCMSSLQYASSHYNLHNLYGLMQAMRTFDALQHIKNQRPFVASRSTFSGQGRYSAHWTGDIESSWDAMKASIPQILTNSILGMPLTGADICGFWDNTTQELCARWHALGAFYPFMRNHNSKWSIPQDPANMGGRVLQVAKKALKLRYCFLPYIYTLMFRSHAFGDTVARPLFLEFPKDVNTFSVETQFLLGSALHVAAVLDPNSTTVRAYLPRGVWYDVMLGIPYHSAGEDFQITPLGDNVALLIRGGSIIISQETAQTTSAARIKPFNLLVAPSHDTLASGELYWDDGISISSYERGDYTRIEFSLVRNSITGKCLHCRHDAIMLLNAITIYGMTERPRNVQFNHRTANFTYNPNGQFVKVPQLHHQLTKHFLVTWSV